MEMKLGMKLGMKMRVEKGQVISIKEAGDVLAPLDGPASIEGRNAGSVRCGRYGRAPMPRRRAAGRSQSASPVRCVQIGRVPGADFQKVTHRCYLNQRALLPHYSVSVGPSLAGSVPLPDARTVHRHFVGSPRRCRRPFARCVRRCLASTALHHST